MQLGMISKWFYGLRQKRVAELRALRIWFTSWHRASFQARIREDESLVKERKQMLCQGCDPIFSFLGCCAMFE
jgi:hypothetical protein